MEDAPYSKKDLRLALSIGSILGWLFIAAPVIYSGGPALLPWAAAFGLPIAFAACWLIAKPILKRVMRHPITWFGALKWGAIISITIALVGIAIGRLNGYLDSLNPNFTYQLGGGKFIREVDGILTPYGWWLLGQNTVIFILAGTTIALIVRFIIGPGRT